MMGWGMGTAIYCFLFRCDATLASTRSAFLDFIGMLARTMLLRRWLQQKNLEQAGLSWGVLPKKLGGLVDGIADLKEH